jgi:GntR family transcriptional regulator
MHSGLLISHADPRPMYLQLIEQIRRRITVGDWEPGRELPSIRALAAATRVSVITVKRAYLELERQGVIVTRHGKGSLVADNVAAGVQLQLQELDKHLAEAATLAEQMGMPVQQLESRLRRMRGHLSGKKRA